MKKKKTELKRKGKAEIGVERDRRWVGHGSGDRLLQIWCERVTGSGWGIVRGEAGSGVRERDRLGVGGLCEEGVARGGGVLRGGGGSGWGVVRGGGGWGGSGWGVVRRGGGWGSSGWLGKEQRQRKRVEAEKEKRERRRAESRSLTRV
jgi:hypothetical protein